MASMAGARQARAASFESASPHHTCIPWRAGGSGRRAGSLLCCHLDGVGEAPRRVPDAKPAIAKPARALIAASERPPMIMGIAVAGRAQ